MFLEADEATFFPLLIDWYIEHLFNERHILQECQADALSYILQYNNYSHLVLLRECCEAVFGLVKMFPVGSWESTNRIIACMHACGFFGIASTSSICLCLVTVNFLGTSFLVIFEKLLKIK